MEEYVIVRETVTVTRYHLVKAKGKSAIKAVKDCDKSAIYLESCDDIDWEGPIKYEIEELKEDWRKDLKLKIIAKHIDERTPEKIGESEKKPLTKRRENPIITPGKKSPDFDALAMLEEIE